MQPKRGIPIWKRRPSLLSSALPNSTTTSMGIVFRSNPIINPYRTFSMSTEAFLRWPRHVFRDGHLPYLHMITPFDTSLASLSVMQTHLVAYLDQSRLLKTSVHRRTWFCWSTTCSQRCKYQGVDKPRQSPVSGETSHSIRLARLQAG